MSNSSARQWKMRTIRSCAGPAGGCKFAVTLEQGNDCISDLKLEAADLLDYATFQAQVLKTSGRLVRFAAVEESAEPAVAWLDMVEACLPEESIRRPAAGFCPSPPPLRHPANGVVPEMTEIGGGD